MSKLRVHGSGEKTGQIQAAHLTMLSLSVCTHTVEITLIICSMLSEVGLQALGRGSGRRSIQGAAIFVWDYYVRG